MEKRKNRWNWKMFRCIISSVCTVSVSEITESYCWAFSQWAIIASLIVLSQTLLTWAAAGRWNESTHQKEAERLHLSFSVLSLFSWGFLFFRATSQKVIFHLANSPVLQAARWKISPVGSLRVLCLQMARRCWWGTLLCAEGRSYRVWVIVTLSALWNASEKCKGWMSQRHGNKNKERIAA